MTEFLEYLAVGAPGEMLEKGSLLFLRGRLESVISEIEGELEEDREGEGGKEEDILSGDSMEEG